MSGRFTLEAVFRARDGLSPAVSKMQSRIQRMTSRSRAGLQKLDKGFAAVTRGIKRAGVAITATAVVAAAAFRNVVGTGAEFEQAITNVGAVGLKTRDDIAVLEKQALSLGESTKFTATQVAGAMEIMAKAGFTVEETFEGIPGVLDAAAASGLEIAEVSRVVSSALKAFASQGLKTTEVADILALASSKTQSDIVSLGESLKSVASTADSLEIPFKDTVAAVALLQDVGLDASVAGSALNTMLTKLAKPPAALAKKMKKLGVAFQDGDKKMLPLPQVLENIAKGMADAGGNMGQVAFLADLVGLRGQKAASNLAKLAKSGDLAKLTEELGNASGSAKKMADIRMDTLTGDLLKLEAATDGVKIALFDMEGGPLRGVVQGMTDWIEKNKEVKLQQISAFIKKVVDNQDILIKRLKQVGTGLAVFFALSAAVKVAAVAMAAFSIAMKIASVAATAFNAIMALNPFVLLGIAVVAVGALIFTFWDNIVAVASGAWSVLKTMFVTGGDFIIGFFEFLFPGVSALVVTMVKAVVDGWIGAFQLLRNIFTGMVSVMRGFVTTLLAVFEPVSTFFAQLWADIAAGFQIIVGPIFKVIGNAIKDIGGLVSLGRGVREGGGGGNQRGFGGGTSPQVVSPQERVSREVSETINESNQSMSMLIKDESGRAEILSKPKNMSVELQQSGEF